MRSRERLVGFAVAFRSCSSFIGWLDIRATGSEPSKLKRDLLLDARLGPYQNLGDAVRLADERLSGRQQCHRNVAIRKRTDYTAVQDTTNSDTMGLAGG